MSLSPDAVLQKYEDYQYQIRYLGPQTEPEAKPEPGVVFGLETGEGVLYGDPLGEPILFATEAEAFARRDALGTGRVLAFHEREIPEPDYVEDLDSIDPATLEDVEEYLEEEA